MFSTIILTKFMYYVMKIIIIILVGFVIYKLLKKRKTIKYGTIGGTIMFKESLKPAGNIVVSLGRVEAKGNSNSFIKDEDYSVTTKEDGKFLFEGLFIKSYWIMAEHKGRKVLKLAKLTNEQNITDELTLTIKE